MTLAAYAFTSASVALGGYLLGSLPTGYLLGRLAGVDIRTVGSGNIGATNVVRVLGKRFGYLVFALDFLKGFGPVLLAVFLARPPGSDTNFVELAAAIGGISAVIGHSFPIWLGFKGGKGVATSIGALFALVPWAALIVCGVWILTFEISRYVSLASVAAAIALPATVAAAQYLRHRNTPVLLCFSICVAIVVVARHRSNISRLMKGTEPRFRRK